MKIGIDANWAIYEQAGIGKYTYNLIKALLEEDKQNEYVLFFNFFRKPRKRMREITELVKDSKARVEVEVSAFPAKLREWLTQTPLTLKYVFKKDVDVLHIPHFSGVPKVGFSKMVVTIYDLAFTKFPDHRGVKISNYYLKRTKQAVENCQKVIAISKTTKKDLEKLLGVSSSKIDVTSLGVGSEFKPIKDSQLINRTIKKYLPIKENFILSVCTLEPRKNLPRLIKAYSMLSFDLQRKYKLVLIGGKGWNNREVFQTINDLNLKEKVYLPGYVLQEDLPYIYNAATVFAYPSLYEGFGLPVLEAMSVGLPVITSNISSLPEIAGKAAEFVNPQKEEEIASALKKILLSENYQKILKKKGLKQAEKFSWQKTARETIKIYEKLAKKKQR